MVEVKVEEVLGDPRGDSASKRHRRVTASRSVPFQSSALALDHNHDMLAKVLLSVATLLIFHGEKPGFHDTSKLIPL